MDKIFSIRALLLLAGLCSAVFVFVASAYAESFPDHVVDYAELNEKSQRGGVFIPIDRLQQVRAGYGRLNQQDVIELLCASHTSSVSVKEDVVQGQEGSIQEDAWVYSVNLPLTGESHLVCQYKVSFYQQVLMSSEWRRPQCDRLYEELLSPAQLR